ncbi:MAG: hypothetical protein KF889_17260 [Alphaproteobacteria bacterium]|nr:hypothetical protein [Alphaproteobacteria bacterium]MCW5739881.1 hypothetical protein [Alphaproteobacteria bacterium]
MRGWLVAAVLPPLLAGCQAPAPPSRELAYCEEMFAIHERYLLPRDFHGNERRDPMADLAVDLCRRNRANEGIPILEHKLRQWRWPLPAR